MPNPAGVVPGSAPGIGVSNIASALPAVGDLAGTVLGAFSKGGIFGPDAVEKKDVINSITWRVAAARKAGVSPLVALGAPVLNTSGGVSLGDFGQMGQDIGRAAGALMAKPDRMAELLAAQQYRRGEAEIALINAQIAKLMQPGTGPGVGAGGLSFAGQKLPEKGPGQEWETYAGSSNPMNWFVEPAIILKDMLRRAFGGGGPGSWSSYLLGKGFDPEWFTPRRWPSHTAPGPYNHPPLR